MPFDYNYSNLVDKVLLRARGAPLIIGLIGELGAGKTTFVQELARKLGVEKRVTSPSFIIHKTYRTKDPKRVLHHIDLYRVNNETELEELEIKNSIKDKNITAIEWADKFPRYLEHLKNESSANLVWIKFEIIKNNKRHVKLLGDK